MKTIRSLLGALSILLLSSCSSAIFHEEFKMDRPLTKSDQAKVERAITGSSFTRSPSLDAALSTRVLVAQPQDGQITFHDALCPFISAAFYKPGPTKWYENNNREVRDILNRLQNDGLHFESMRPLVPRPTNNLHNKSSLPPGMNPTTSTPTALP